MGLNDDELRNRLQETIIGITGVLSITFDKPRNLIIVFIRETKDESRHLVVKKAIAYINLWMIISRNVLEEMSNAEIPTDNDGETDFVDELMDMDGGKDALTMYGFSSIESRLEAKRAEQEKKEKEKKKKNWLISRVSQVLSSWWYCVCSQHMYAIACNSNCERPETTDVVMNHTGSTLHSILTLAPLC